MDLPSGGFGTDGRTTDRVADPSAICVIILAQKMWEWPLTGKNDRLLI
jgi:hypothetical protein